MKMFTQEEVDEIIKNRLAREKKKLEKELNISKATEDEKEVDSNGRTR